MLNFEVLCDRLFLGNPFQFTIDAHNRIVVNTIVPYKLLKIIVPENLEIQPHMSLNCGIKLTNVPGLLAFIYPIDAGQQYQFFLLNIRNIQHLTTQLLFKAFYIRWAREYNPNIIFRRQLE